MNKEEVENIWKKWFELKSKGIIDLNIKNQLVEHYYFLLVNIAKKAHERIKEVSVEEFISTGVPGLYDAISNFNPEKFKYKAKFETYAQLRIYGSMIDDIRKNDWVPRQVRQRAKEFNKIKSALESDAKRKLSTSELAEKLGKTKEEMEEMVEKSTASTIFNMHESGYSDNNEENSFLYQVAEDEKTVHPINEMVRKEFFNKLMGNNFSPQERKIVWMIYFEKKTIKEISDSINMSPSGISQKHLSIIDKLKQKAKRNPSYFKDISTMIGKK